MKQSDEFFLNPAVETCIDIKFDINEFNENSEKMKLWLINFLENTPPCKQTLTPREQKVLRLIYCPDDNKHRTFREIGQQVGVTSNNVSQINIKALKMWRKSIKEEK